MKLRKQDPIIIGGFPGSGTRVVARVFKELGCWLGDRVSEYMDNVELGRRLVGSLGDPAATRRALEHFSIDMEQLAPDDQRSVFKYPDTHFFLPQIIDEWPKMTYIHVIRHGLDMCLSKNQGHAERYAYLLNVAYLPRNPVSFLRYWIAANHRAIAIGCYRLGCRCLVVRFEDICRSPLTFVDAMSKVAGLFPKTHTAEPPTPFHRAAAFIQTPETIGRWKRWKTGLDLSIFPETDLRAVREFGYETEKG